MLIRELDRAGLRPYSDLLGEVEAGARYDPANPDNVRWLEQRLGGHIARGAVFYGLFDDDGSPVGIASLLTERFLHTEFSVSWLLDLGVMPDQRGKGYGSKLLTHLEEEARRAGSHCFYLWTYAGDHRNVAFYAKNGFVPVATLPDVNGPGAEGDVYMRKLLT